MCGAVYVGDHDFRKVIIWFDESPRKQRQNHIRMWGYPWGGRGLGLKSWKKEP